MIPDAPPTLSDVVLTLISGAPALAVAVGAYALHRRDCHAMIKVLREDNARLLEALTRATGERMRP